MRWEGRRESDNVEDQRGSSAGMFGGRMPGRSMLAGGGLGTIIVVLIVSAIFRVNPLQLLQQIPQQPGNPQVAPQGVQIDPAHERLVKFVKVVLADTEDVWHDQFRRMGKEYREPKLVLFSRMTESGCGLSDAAVGPFYCP